jgi:uncharacterized protein with PQ loop repeat
MQRLGPNPYTVIFLGTIVFTLLTGWYLVKQYKKIRKNPEKAGKSVNFPWFISSALMFLMIIVYGFMLNDFAMKFNGLLSLLHIPTLKRLSKYKPFGIMEKATTLVFSLLIFWLFFAKNKQMVVFIALSIRVVPYVLQPLEIYNNRSRGVVDIGLILIYMLSSFFWSSYFIWTHKLLLASNGAIYFLITLATTILWFKFPEKEQTP